MKIQIVSYRKNTKPVIKVDLTAHLFNDSQADLILFPGHTIDTSRELEKLSSKLNNSNTTAFLELKELGSRGIRNWAFKIEKNKLVNCHTHQLFASSAEVNDSPYLIETLFNEIQNNRIHKVNSKRICLLLCGELNLLTNLQKKKNKVQFRTSNVSLAKEYNTLFKNIDLFLNPLHTPMGNQGKMHKRREFLSTNNRAYFSTGNLENKGSTYEATFRTSKALQYGYYNGKELDPIKQIVNKNYIIRDFKI